MKKNIDTVRLFVGHNILVGNKPSIVTLEVLGKAIEEQGKQELEKFGLFDTAAPNYATYYPDVSAEDLVPKDTDFITPTYRALSNTVVHPRFNPIYFSEAVLKRNMYKLIGQSINIDHEVAVGNAIGSVSKVGWQNSYKTKEGFTIPAGINAELKIDGKSNPRIARGINMDPPSIHSTSVTVTFAWVKSHPTLSDSEFWDKLGTFDAAGKLIKRDVTDIEAFHEISLVSHGADYFAQKVNEDGKIVNPAYAASKYNIADSSLSDGELKVAKNSKSFYYDFKELATETFSEENTIPEELNNILTTNDMDFLKLIAAIFGTELSEDNYETVLKTLHEDYQRLKAAETNPQPVVIGTFTGVEAIGNEITRLSEEVTRLTGELATVTALADSQKESVTLSTTLVNDLRVDALRLYKASLGEKAEDPNIVALINTAQYVTLKALHKQYDELTDHQFQFHCTDCGSKNVSRMSSKPSEETEPVTKTNSEVVNKFTSVPKKVNTRFIQ